ncbi:MAG: CRISPR-associated endonuclease Cas1 [Candidatus Poribacteria bacterium]|nr:CRISPR-associated endonuclease Cas1 [Candidatus Poribacteria bacterium]MDE0469881.1 CRISPR-associated endonuclease Cas1 [Candidatus Poribacteria bacterium]
MAILYITQQGAMLHKSGNQIIVKKEREVLQEIPIVQLDEVVIFGNGHITTPTMGYLLSKNIPVSFLSSRGKYKGKLQPPYAKDTLIRQQQYAVASDPPQCLELAKCFVRGKLTNAMRFCQRQRTQNDEVKSAILSTRQTLEKLEGAKNLESLLGYEGAGAAAYYQAFRQFLARDWGFTTRQFRPPPDPINAMLSLGYTLLHNHVYAFTNVVGLDPYCGYFHQPKHGHAALASDLMEEFRQIIVDGYVLSLVNNNRIKPKDFEKTNNGIRFTKEALDRFLTGYYGRMQRTFQHPTRNEKTTHLRCIELQVRHLARVIRGKEAVYKPFLVRA